MIKFGTVLLTAVLVTAYRGGGGGDLATPVALLCLAASFICLVLTGVLPNDRAALLVSGVLLLAALIITMVSV